MPTTMLPLARERRDDLLDPLRDLVLGTSPAEGHTVLLFPDLCVYRYSEPTTFRKAATLGVTLGVVLQGSKRIRVGEREMTVTPDRFFLVTRETELEAAIVSATGRRPYLGLGVCFGPERVARALLAMAEAGGRTTTAPEDGASAFMVDPDQALTGALERLLQAAADPVNRRLLVPLVLDEILFRLLRTPAAATIRNGVGPGGDVGRILAVMRFIRQHHADKLTVGRLAREAAMSPSHFAHRFRAVARVSPMRYLRHVRLDAARSLLLESGARVSQVAVTVGFESPAHFTREFKRRFGVTPSRSLDTAHGNETVVS
jgi:AraC-like DNA-binding protein